MAPVLICNKFNKNVRQALAQMAQCYDHLKLLLDDPLPHRRKEPTPRRHAWSIQHLNKTAGTCRRAPAQMTLCSDQLRLLLGDETSSPSYTIGRTDSGINFLEHRQRPAASACFSARDGALNG
jgi:hypothetical protein